ncbi:MAG: EAL domain-containing protein [Pseudomonadales bacterium]|nr:EAL domain-containing protein [Pseudomonadales bacterium]
MGEQRDRTARGPDPSLFLPGDAGEAPPGPEASLSVLVVDDRADLRESLCRLVAAEGYRVAAAEGGAACLLALDRAPADLVLLDLVMPDMPGLEVIDAVRERGIDTRIIVVSGEASFEYAQRALTRGAVDFIRKPYEPAELLAAVARVADQIRLARRNRWIAARLERSEQLHRFIVESSPDLVYMLDADGRFVFLNERVETLLGLSRAELLGQHYRALLPASQHEAARHVFDERRTGERASRNVELRLRRQPPAHERAGATEIEVEVTAMGVYLDASMPSPGGRVGTYGIARDISERKRAQEMIQFQAHHDLLTYLPNRALLRDRLELALAQARRSGRRLALMFLDLDRFKIVNDTLGHTTGDRLLRAVALRLKQCIRRGDTLARFGGDEFCLLLPEVRSTEDVRVIARKILDQLSDPFQVEDHELFIGASIGIALYPEAGATAESLIQHADIAMYDIKGRGRNGYQVFSEHMNERFASRLSEERELRNALQNGELEPHYQPLVDVASGRVIGVEALARWRHPQRGLLEPSAFLPLAEETGLIVAVDRVIQRLACQDVARWRACGMPELALSLNVSAAQIEQDDFVQEFLALLQRTGIGTTGIRLEIAERVIMRDTDIVQPKFEALADQGVAIGIDDFGTGYSSLSHLQRFPVTSLKIDRRFVAEIGAAQQAALLVDGIIHMARGLGIDIIAEGVETDLQLNYLHGQGCLQAQGYVYARAMTADALGALLAAGTAYASPSAA